MGRRLAPPPGQPALDLTWSASGSETIAQSDNHTTTTTSSRLTSPTGNTNNSIQTTDTNTSASTKDATASFQLGVSAHQDSPNSNLVFDDVNLNTSGNQTVHSTTISLETWHNVNGQLIEDGNSLATQTRDEVDTFGLSADGYDQANASGATTFQTDSFVLSEQGQATFTANETISKTSVESHPFSNGAIAAGLGLVATFAPWDDNWDSLASAVSVPDTATQTMNLSETGNESFQLSRLGAGDGATLTWDHAGSSTYLLYGGDKDSWFHDQTLKTGGATFSLHQHGTIQNGGFVVNSFVRDEQGLDREDTSLTAAAVGGVILATGMESNQETSLSSFHWHQEGTPAQSTYLWESSKSTGGSGTWVTTEGTDTRSETVGFSQGTSASRAGTVGSMLASVTLGQHANQWDSTTETDSNPLDSFTRTDSSSDSIVRTQSGTLSVLSLAIPLTDWKVWSQQYDLGSFSYTTSHTESHSDIATGTTADGTQTFSINNGSTDTASRTASGSYGGGIAGQFDHWVSDQNYSSHSDLSTTTLAASAPADPTSPTGVEPVLVSDGGLVSPTLASATRWYHTDSTLSDHAEESGNADTPNLDSYVYDDTGHWSSSDGSGGGTNTHAQGSGANGSLFSQTYTDWSTDSAGNSTFHSNTIDAPASLPQVPQAAWVSDGLAALRQVSTDWKIFKDSLPGLSDPRPTGDPTAALGAQKQEGLAAQILLGANSAVPTGYEALSGWQTMANQLRGLLGSAAGMSQQARAGLGTDLGAAWQATLDQGIQAWQAMTPQVLAALQGYSTGENQFAVAQSQIPSTFSPTYPSPPVWTGDILKDLTNLFGAWANNLTFGLYYRAMQAIGWANVFDTSSGAWALGNIIGQVHNSLLMVFSGGATGWAQTAVQGLNYVGMVGATLQGVDALRDGDIGGALMAFAQIGLLAVRGMDPCNTTGIVTWGQRAIQGVMGAQSASNAFQAFSNGDYLQGFASLFDAGANFFLMSKACFTADTLLWSPTGPRPIVQFVQGDQILSRDEHHPEGPVEVKVVEEVFQRLGRILEVRVGGQVIKTTPEHPFWVRGRGWTPAGELKGGEEFSGRDGGWTKVESVKDTGRYEVVYNLRVSDYHTYFVGGLDWGFDVWAHNAYQINDKAYRDGYDAIFGSGKYKGGLHETTKLPVNDGLESHHMPAKSVNGLHIDDGPAIQMEPGDHQQTASHGSQGLAGAAYRAQQLAEIRNGRFGAAIQMDINDVRAKFASKYDGAIQQMLDSLAPWMRRGLNNPPW